MASLGYSLGATGEWRGRLNFTCCRAAVKWDMNLESGMLL
jgi:hypothetical protein